MSFELVGPDITLTTATDMTGQQFLLVVASTAGAAQVVATNGAFVFGPVLDKSTGASDVRVRIRDVSRVQAGGSTATAIAIGASLKASSAATVINTTGIGDYIIGRALEALSSGSTGVIAMLVTHEGQLSS